MASHNPPVKGETFEIHLPLSDQANPNIPKTSPTLAAADFEVVVDGVSLGAMDTTPTVEPEGGKLVKFQFSAAETNGTEVNLIAVDAAGDEWFGWTLVLFTVDNQFDDLATAAALTTAQNDLDKLTGSDGATLATSQPNYAPNTITPPTVAAFRSEMDANSTQLAAILTDTDTTIPALIAALNNLSAADVNAQVDAAFTTLMADSVPADGTMPTREQAIYMIVQFLLERVTTGTSVSVKKVDGSTELFGLTLDDADSPTSITRSA